MHNTMKSGLQWTSLVLVSACVVAFALVARSRAAEGSLVRIPGAGDAGRLDSLLLDPPEVSQRSAVAEGVVAPVLEPAAVEAAFDIREAQARNRSIVTPLHEDYRGDFLRKALKWEGPNTPDASAARLLRSPALNPQEKSLHAEDVVELDKIVQRYHRDLAALAEQSFAHAGEGHALYYDSFAGSGWVRDDLPRVTQPRPEPPGRWNRTVSVSHAGYRRTIAFDSSYHQPLEDSLEATQALQVERAEAVRRFIEERGW